MFTTFLFLDCISLCAQAFIALSYSDYKKFNIDCSAVGSPSPPITPSQASSNHNIPGTPAYDSVDSCFQNALFTLRLQFAVGLVLSIFNLAIVVILLLKGMSLGTFDHTEQEFSIQRGQRGGMNDLYYASEMVLPWDTVAEPLPIYRPKENDPPRYSTVDFELFDLEDVHVAREENRIDAETRVIDTAVDMDEDSISIIRPTVIIPLGPTPPPSPKLQ